MKLVWEKLKYDLTGCRGEFELSPVMAFVGDPMVGKTTVLRAIELAMTGDKGIIGGRDASQFLSTDSDTVFSKLTGRLGDWEVQAVWEAKNDGGVLKDAVHSKHPKEAHLAEFLQTPAKLRTTSGGALERMISARFGGGDFHLDDEELADLLAKLSAEHTEHPPGSLAAALDVAEWCSTEIKALGRQIGAAKRAAEKTTDEVLDAEKLREDLADKKAELGEAKKELDAHPRLSEVRKEIETAEAKLGRLQSKLATIDGTLGKLEGDCVTCSECGASRPREMKKFDNLTVTKKKYVQAILTTQTKIAKNKVRETVITKEAGTKVELLEDDITQIEAQLEAAKKVKTETKKSNTHLKRWQDKYRALREEITSSLDEIRGKAIQDAEERVTSFTIDGVRPHLLRSPLRWGVSSRGAVRWASASGSQVAALDLALTLAWAEDEYPPVVIHDDAHFTNFSREQTIRYLQMLSVVQLAGSVSQVFVARPADRKDVPKRYTQIKIGE